MSRMFYCSPRGTVIDLVAPGDWDRRIAYGGVSGLVGEKTVATVATVMSAGQVPTGVTVGPMDGILVLTLAPSAGGRTLDSLHSELVREFLSDKEGTLVLERDAFQPLFAKVRLNGVIDFPQSFLDAGDVDSEVKIPLVADLGMWVTGPLTGTGTVTVTNNGDFLTWPRIRWMGAPTIRLPSGVNVQLPNAASERILSLNPETSHEVTHPGGTVDSDLSDITAQLTLGESVPEGRTRTYVLSDGATLEWTLAYLNPWR